MSLNKVQYDSYTNESETKIQLSFEDILSKIGFGKYQIYVFIIVGLIGMCDAGETQALSLVLPILEKEWGISNFQESLLGSLVYVGYFCGSLISGEIADKKGRKGPINVASIIMFVVAVIGAFMPNFVLYTIFRVILVGCIGFIIPISFSMLTENTPIKERGIVLICIGIFYTMGELTVCLLAYIFMPTLTSGNWRAVLFYASVPAFLTILISFLLMKESARFCLIEGQVDAAKTIIDSVLKCNKINEVIPIETYQYISDQLRLQEQEEQGEIGDNIQQFKKLLSRQFARITSIIWYQWFTNTFVYAGITFLLPLTLQKLKKEEEDNTDLKVITLSVLLELPVILIALFLVNQRKFGRKNTLALGYFVVGVLGILIFILNGWIFGVMIATSKMFMSLAFTVSYQFVSELYPTYMRASGIGYASSVGRIGSIIMPWIVIYFNEIGTFISYAIFGSLGIIAFIATLLLPFDTFGRELDKVVV